MLLICKFKLRDASIGHKYLVELVFLVIRFDLAKVPFIIAPEEETLSVVLLWVSEDSLS